MDKVTKKLADLAEMVNGEVKGDPDLIIHGLGDLATAAEGEIGFITRESRHGEIAQSKASAVIVPLEIKEADKTLLRVKDPNLAATIIHNVLLARPFSAGGISNKAHIGSGCTLPEEISIGPMATLGERVFVGKRVTIHPGVVIGDDAVIGNDTVLFPSVTIYKGCKIGSRVIIHSGTVIGSDGFGYATDENGIHLKRPHTGIVQIEDDVEIGANVCVDRGTIGHTLIKKGTKIDNLVQVAHNVTIGENSIIVAQVGIAGSATLGKNVVLGGQAGVKGHIRLEDRVMVAAKAGVNRNLKKGSVVSGFPAIPHNEWLKAITIFSKLPKLFQEVRELKKQISTLNKDRFPSDNSDVS